MKRIEGFTDYYVRKDGTIWSIKVNKLKQIKGFIVRGYLVVCLYGHGKKQHKFVHRLVLEAFIGPCPDGMQCRHLDGDKLNNRLSNVVWGTPAQNGSDKVTHQAAAKGEEVSTSKLTNANVRKIRLLTSAGRTQKSLADQFNVHINTVGRIVRNQTWLHLNS